MSEPEDEVTAREPKLDEVRWAVLALRVSPVDGTYDPRAARTTLHMLDEDSEELIAVEQCGVIADEPDVYKAFLVKMTVDDEFEGRAKIAIDGAGQYVDDQLNTGSVEGQPAVAKPSTPLTNVTAQHNQQPKSSGPTGRGLRLQNPKGESWRNNQ